MGFLSAPTVTPVCSSKASTGLTVDWPVQAASDPTSKMKGISGVRICPIIPRRELQLIMSYRLHAIILTMSIPIRRLWAKSLRAKFLWATLALIICAVSPPRGALAEEIATVDRVVVHKAEHKLYLYSGSRLLGEYKVELGLNPSGQKEREHDFRTPEGRYYLSRRNTRSDFFLAIQVSYPNKEDELRAR